MRHDLRPRSAFAIYSLADPAAEEVLVQLRRSELVADTVATLIDISPRPVALRDAMAMTDIIVAVVPPPQNRERSNVIFEVGVAVGLAKPVLLLAFDRSLPRDLSELPFLGLSDIARLDTALVDAMRNPVSKRKSRMPAGRKMSDAGTLSYAGPDAFVSSEKQRHVSAFAKFTEADLREHFAQLLKSRGVEVIVPSRRPDGPATPTPDLVLWDDALLPSFGLPLPMEFVRSTEGHAKLRARLQHTLRASGARSLIAVAAAGDEDRRWANGQELILTVGAERLDAALKSLDVPTALTVLLERATA